jgi:hypothetical protein
MLRRLEPLLLDCTLCVFLTLCSFRMNDRVLSKCQCHVAARAILHSRADPTAEFPHTRGLLFSTS